MKDVKFRAWVRFLGKMARVDELMFNSGSALVNEYPYAIESDAFDLMQYTGLKDKNGVEIYAGDIFNDGFDNCIVKWCEKEMAFVADDGLEIHRLGKHTCDENIIGNIYENPELLGK